MKVAILLWGCVRGFKYAMDSHKKHVWSILDQAGHDYHVYVSTSNKEYDACVEAIPNLQHLHVYDDKSSEEEVLPKVAHLVLPLYFKPEHKPNLMKCFLAQQYLRDYLTQHNLITHYDIMLTMDIAHVFESDIPELSSLDLSYGYIPNLEQYTGFNPRFFLGTPQHVLFYLNKLAYILEDPCNISSEHIHSSQRAQSGQIKVNYHPESSLKYYLTQVGGISVQEFSLCFYRIRSNGDVIRQP